jgi:lipocalin-like protein
MLVEKIVGVWELQTWETMVDDSVVGYPLGEEASGFIAYHPIGFMSVNIPHPIVFASQLRIPSQGTQSSWR